MNKKKVFNIIGIPWDMGASLGRPGSRYAPQMVREKLKWILMRITDNKIYDVEQKKVINLKDVVIEDSGDIDLYYYDLKLSFEMIRRKALESLISGKFLIAIGGDHSISFPLIQALHDKTTKNIGLIQLDAHLDLLDENKKQGKYSQSSEIFRALELERLRPENLVQIGIRGYNYPEAFNFAKGNNITQFTALEVHEFGAIEIAKKTLEIVSNNTDEIYLTLDIDVLDPGFAPGAGVDEPGGLTPIELHSMMKIFASEISCFDIVEINPSFDVHGMTSAIGAKILFSTIVNSM